MENKLGSDEQGGTPSELYKMAMVLFIAHVITSYWEPPKLLVEFAFIVGGIVSALGPTLIDRLLPIKRSALLKCFGATVIWLGILGAILVLYLQEWDFSVLKMANYSFLYFSVIFLISGLIRPHTRDHRPMD